MENRYSDLIKASNKKREHGDCAVKALAVVTGRSYNFAHKTLKRMGRRDRMGTPRIMTLRAVQLLGFKLKLVEKHAMNKAKTVRTLESKIPSKGTFLVHVKGHVIAVKGGMIHDWSYDSCRRIQAIYRVSKA